MVFFSIALVYNILSGLLLSRGVKLGFDLGLLKIEKASEEAADETALSELFATK